MVRNDISSPHNNCADGKPLDTLLVDCLDGDKATYERLASAALPRLLGLSARFLETPEHAETICQDTLLLAWRNLSGLDSSVPPSQWLYGIFGSRLYNHLLALHGSRQAMLRNVRALANENTAMVDSPTGPRPALLSGASLAAMVQQVPSVAPSRQLLKALSVLISAEIAQRHAPLTPTGERVYPPLFDPALRYRMFRSRAAFRMKEGFKRYLGRPFEDKLFQRWLDNKAGSTLLESQGLPRRSVETYLDGTLDLEIDPSLLNRGFDFPASFPNRTQRRKISNLFIWPGDWDLTTPNLTDTQRQRFIRDIWAHRLDLTASDNYANLMKRHEQGNPLRLHHQGILLDSEVRILAYLKRYQLYMEDMSHFGFKAGLTRDHLGIVIDRHGGMIKINKGLHRLAMVQTLGIQRATVRVRGVHQLWWDRHKGNAQGRQALENMVSALAL